MKIEQLAEIVTMLAQNHPGAEVSVVHRAKHGPKGYSNILKPITGYQTRMRFKPGSIYLNVDGAEYDGKDDKRDAE